MLEIKKNNFIIILFIELLCSYLDPVGTSPTEKQLKLTVKMTQINYNYIIINTIVAFEFYLEIEGCDTYMTEFVKTFVIESYFK